MLRSVSEIVVDIFMDGAHDDFYRCTMSVSEFKKEFGMYPDTRKFCLWTSEGQYAELIRIQ